MKSIKEIEIMLLEEVCKKTRKIEILGDEVRYYNESMGDVSFLLAGLLHQHLKTPSFEWCDKNWIDDCLLTGVQRVEDEVSICGTVIWGKEGANSQWVEPFFFKMKLDCDNSIQYRYVLMFGDLNCAELTYEEFSQNREVFDIECCTSNYCNSHERQWKYVIYSNESHI